MTGHSRVGSSTYSRTDSRVGSSTCFRNSGRHNSRPIPRSNAARGRKQIHLPPLQLREAFSSFTPFLLLLFRDGSSRQELPRRVRIRAPICSTIGNGHSRGCHSSRQESLRCVLGRKIQYLRCDNEISPLFEIALVLVRLDYVACRIIKANPGIVCAAAYFAWPMRFTDCLRVAKIVGR